jgi:hypothetical protein
LEGVLLLRTFDIAGAIELWYDGFRKKLALSLAPSIIQWTRQEIVDLKSSMNYPAAEQRGIYKGIVTPQAAGN